MSKLIKKAIAVVLAMCSFLFVMDTTVTAIKVVETMRIAGEITNVIACAKGMFYGVSVVLVCGAILAFLMVAIDRINNNKKVI